MFLRLLPLIFFISVFSVSADQGTNGHASIAALTPGEVRVISDSISTDKALLLPLEVENSAPTDPELSSYWRGNHPKYNAELNDISISLNKFDLFVRFDDEKVLLKHPHVLNQELIGGIYLRDDPQKQRRIFLRAANKTSLIIILPRFDTREPSRGIMICPRDFTAPSGSADQRKLMDTDFSINNVKIDVHASGEAYMKSGMDVAWARLQLLTTPTLPRSQAWNDESLAKDPEVYLNYRADEKDVVAPDYSIDDVVTGIKFSSELQTRPGFKRRSEQDFAVHLQRIKNFVQPPLMIAASELLNTPFKHVIPLIDGRVAGNVGYKVEIANGNCLYVMRRKSPVKFLYSQEAFVDEPANEETGIVLP